MRREIQENFDRIERRKVEEPIERWANDGRSRTNASRQGADTDEDPLSPLGWRRGGRIEGHGMTVKRWLEDEDEDSFVEDEEPYIHSWRLPRRFDHHHREYGRGDQHKDRKPRRPKAEFTCYNGGSS